MRPDLKAGAVQAHAAGRLLPWLITCVTGETTYDPEMLYAAVIKLHNLGEIDAVSMLLDSSLGAGPMPDYLAVAQTLTGIVPHLSADVTRMMQAISAVKAPSLQHVLDEVFLAWCGGDAGRVAAVVALDEAGQDVADKFFLCALLAGLRIDLCRYAELALRIANGKLRDDRLLGLRALGLLPVTVDTLTERVLSELAGIVGQAELDASVRAAALSASWDVAVRAPHVPQPRIMNVVEGLTGDDEQMLLEACANAFGRHATALTDDMLDDLSRRLPRLDPQRTHALDMVDMGLYQLLVSRTHEARPVFLLERLLSGTSSDAILEKLDSVSHELSNGDPARFGRLTARFLLSGKPALGRAVASLAQNVHSWDGSLEIDFTTCTLTAEQGLFLARKAVGWLFFRPVTAASVVVSVIQHVAPADAEQLGDLLLDPILMNYPGSVRRYLDHRAPALSLPAAAVVAQALAKYGAYLAALVAVGPVPELHPSEHNQRIEHQRQADAMISARREAEEKSVLRSLVHKSLLLHGVRSISHVRNFDGTVRRLDTKLARISAEIEHPMQSTFDPLGLESSLMQFRLEPPPE